MSEERFKEYTPILEALVAEAISCSPETWVNGKLTIECDGRAINYMLKNSESEDKANISDDLAQLCEKIYVTMSQYNDTWSQSIVTFFEKDGSWSYNVEFNYLDKGEKLQKKPWWKVW
ncbi:MAG: hypothetical protein OEZ39_16265 [Gammaproteobacteria bacterium]|nr:hypothetical protein [Gammaproteobacteria bacterium]MDH5653414.1 hypothetical protein [Gammaproteobacteria bacterium]